MKRKESLIHNDFVIGVKQIVHVTIQIYWFQPKNNVLLMLIDNQFASMDAKRNNVTSLISMHITLKYLSIGTPETINFPFVSNGKIMGFKCPNIQAHYNEAVVYLDFGTPKSNEFFIWNKWKIYYF